MKTPTAENNKQFITNATSGDLQGMMRAYDLGVDVDANGAEALREAAIRGHDKCVEYILAHGGDVNTKSVPHGSTALMAAAYGGQIKIVQILLATGADSSLQGGSFGNSTQPRYAHEWAKVNNNVNNLTQQNISTVIEEALNGWVSSEIDEELSKKTNTVVVSRTLGSRVLQEHFNFVSLDRLTFVRKGQNGPVESTVRQDFAEIADKKSIRDAAQLGKERGIFVNEGNAPTTVAAQGAKKITMNPLKQDQPAAGI